MNKVKKIATTATKTFKSVAGAFNKCVNRKTAPYIGGAMLAMAATNSATAGTSLGDFNNAGNIAGTALNLILAAKDGNFQGEVVDTALDELTQRAIKTETAGRYNEEEYGFTMSWHNSLPKRLIPDTMHIRLLGGISFAKITTTEQHKNKFDGVLSMLGINPEKKAKTNYDNPDSDNNQPTTEVERNIKNSSSQAKTILGVTLMEEKMGLNIDQKRCKYAADNPDQICGFLAEKGVSVPDYGKEALEKGNLDVFFASIMDADETQNGKRRDLEETLDTIPNHLNPMGTAHEETPPKQDVANNKVSAVTIMSLKGKGNY